MKIKTSELIGVQLDWAVAQVEGIPTFMESSGFGYWRDIDMYPGAEFVRYSPPTDWSRGGPLIERFKVGVIPLSVGLQNDQPDAWFSTAFYDGVSAESCCKGYGSTALESACRAIVGLKLGDEVDVPEWLV